MDSLIYLATLSVYNSERAVCLDLIIVFKIDSNKVHLLLAAVNTVHKSEIKLESVTLRFILTLVVQDLISLNTVLYNYYSTDVSSYGEICRYDERHRIRY
jgi:ABC-type transporter Mla MlaB component